MGGYLYKSLNTDYNKVCVVKGVHKTNQEEYEHFSIYFYNNVFNTLLQRNGRGSNKSPTYHIFINDTGDITDMTAIVSYPLR